MGAEDILGGMALLTRLVSGAAEKQKEQQAIKEWEDKFLPLIEGAEVQSAAIGPGGDKRDIQTTYLPPEEFAKQLAPGSVVTGTHPKTGETYVFKGPPQKQPSAESLSMDKLKAGYVASVLQTDPQRGLEMLHNLTMGTTGVDELLEQDWYNALKTGDPDALQRATMHMYQYKSLMDDPTEFEKIYGDFMARMKNLGYKPAPPDRFKNKQRIMEFIVKNYGPRSGMLGMFESLNERQKVEILYHWLKRRQMEEKGPRLFTDDELNMLENDVIGALRLNPLIASKLQHAYATGEDVDELYNDLALIAEAYDEAGGDMAKFSALLPQKKAIADAQRTAKGKPKETKEPAEKKLALPAELKKLLEEMDKVFTAKEGYTGGGATPY